MTLDPFLRLMEHAESRKKMTKAQLLKDAADGDDAYLNASSERDMYEAYADDLRQHLQQVHKCTHDLDVIHGGLDAEELHPAAPWNDVSD